MATGGKGATRWTAEAVRVLDLLNSLGTTIFRQLVWQKAADLTFAQSQVLFYVAEHPACHMGDVAKAFGVTLPAVTHIVDRLEQKELLVRGDHPADRRIYVLELTRTGKALSAVAEDPVTASLLGINTGRLIVFTFFVSPP